MVMKMLTKEECKTALSKLWDNTFGTDCITGEDLDKYVDVIDGLIQYVFNPQPYKFENLKVGMWVWDEKEKKCNKIIEIEGRNIDFYYITESIDRFIVEFEENRFYHVTKALEYQK